MLPDLIARTRKMIRLDTRGIRESDDRPCGIGVNWPIPWVGSRASNVRAPKQTTITNWSTTRKGRGMAFDDSLIVDHLLKTHSTELLSEQEKHLIGLAVTAAAVVGYVLATEWKKARGIGITDEELNAVIAVASRDQ